MQFYANENFPRQVVEALRALGHDVLTSLDAGRANQRVPDDEVLKFAVEKGRVLLTINRKDFVKLHNARPATERTHAGIVVCTQDIDHAGQAGRIVTALEAVESSAGRLLRVNRPA